jgi:hypothetical protein
MPLSIAPLGRIREIVPCPGTGNPGVSPAERSSHLCGSAILSFKNPGKAPVLPRIQVRYNRSKSRGHPTMANEAHQIGKSVPRKEGREKVTGTAFPGHSLRRDRSEFHPARKNRRNPFRNRNPLGRIHHRHCKRHPGQKLHRAANRRSAVPRRSASQPSRRSCNAPRSSRQISVGRSSPRGPYRNRTTASYFHHGGFPSTQATNLGRGQYLQGLSYGKGRCRFCLERRRFHSRRNSFISSRKE